MQRVFSNIKYLLILLLTLGFANLSLAQDKKTETEIKSLLTSKNFVFKAQSVSPTGGSFRQLNTDYDVRVSGDTVRTFLPYFGRSYSAPIGATDGGIKFTSTDFDYELAERKKDRMEVLIRPKDVQDVRQLLLTVSKNGHASLQVLSNNRQPISFNGYVTDKKPR